MFVLRLALPVAGWIEGLVGKDEAAGEMISAAGGGLICHLIRVPAYEQLWKMGLLDHRVPHQMMVNFCEDSSSSMVLLVQTPYPVSSVILWLVFQLLL